MRYFLRWKFRDVGSNFVVRARESGKKGDASDERVNFGDGLGDSAADQLAGERRR